MWETSLHKACAYKYTVEKNYGWETFTYPPPKIYNNVGLIQI